MKRKNLIKRKNVERAYKLFRKAIQQMRNEGINWGEINWAMPTGSSDDVDGWLNDMWKRKGDDDDDDADI